MPRLSGSNWWVTQLAVGIVSTTTTINVGSSEDIPPAPFRAGLGDVNAPKGEQEIIEVIAVSGLVLTVIRGLEGTTARAWSVGTRIESRWTAGAHHELVGVEELAVFERLINKGVAGGYAPLGAGARVPAVHLGSGTVVAVYNASGVWTKADYPGATMAFIEAWGGGGSGGRGSGATGRGGGGGGGGYARILIPLALLGATETVTVGAGGAVQTAAGNGFVGGNSLFGTHLTAFGGGGGGGGAAAAHNAGGGGGGALGAGGSAVAATVGAGGAPAIAAQVNVGFGGGPGGLPTAGGFGAAWGGGGGAGGNIAAPGGASLYGGGGGGGNLATSPGGTSRYGGAGGAGVVDAVAGNAGLVPGGGGSGSNGANSGAGGAGRVRVIVW